MKGVGLRSPPRLDGHGDERKEVSWVSGEAEEQVDMVSKIACSHCELHVAALTTVSSIT